MTNIFSGMSGQSMLVDALEHRAGLDQRWAEARSTLRVAAITSAAGTPLSVTSPTTKPTRPSGQLDEVVEVAAHLAGRPVVGGDAASRAARAALGQEVLLDQPGDLELLLDALARARLGLLLAHELADPQRRRRLRGQVLEQPRSSHEYSCSDSRGPRLSTPISSPWVTSGTTSLTPAARSSLERGRVELEPVDVDGAGRALEVGEQRVVRRDLDRRARRGARPAAPLAVSTARRRGAAVAASADDAANAVGDHLMHLRCTGRRSGIVTGRERSHAERARDAASR